VFAAGDIIEWEEEKQVGKTAGQAAVVAKNIISYLANKPLKKQYDGSPEMIILTNGKVWASASSDVSVPDYLHRLNQSSGAAYLPFLWGLVFGPWFTRMVKSKTLLLGFARSSMGL
jgi:NADH dehydrogenase FAD-containing subunit